MIDVAIVGGGIAGLAAAYELRQRDIQFTLLEAALRSGASASPTALSTDGR